MRTIRERNIQINIRVNKTEKETIHRKAKRCGMADSEYIRNCALDRTVTEMPREGLKLAYRKIGNVAQKLEQYSDTQQEVAALRSAQEALLDLYHGKEVIDGGSDEDLAGQG